MLAYSTFAGRRIDLQHYKNFPVINFEVDVLNPDGSVYSFEDAVSMTFEFYAKPHGKLLDTVEVDIPADNKILLDMTESVFNRRPGLYFHECYYMTNDSPSSRVLIFYGISEII